MLQRSKRQSSVAIWVLCLFPLAVQLSSRCQSWWSKGQCTIETLHLVSEVGYGAAVLSAHHTEVNMGPKHHHKVVKMGEAAPVESREEGATGGPPVGLQSGEEPPVSADMNSIFSMVQRCLQFQSDLRERWDRETVKQEQRWRQMQVQVNNLRDEVETQQRVEPQPQPGPSSQRPAEPFLSSPARSEPAARGWAQTAVPKLEEGDDIEQYLTTFERLAAAYQWPEVDWAVRLVPYLTGKARAAYVAMAADDTLDYKMVKEAILTKYEINEEVYRQRFREPDIQPGETPREFYNRLRDLYQKWMQPEKKTKEQVGEVLILEQFYRSLSPELRVWVKERNPTSAREAAELVENFLAARRGPKTFRQVRGPLDVLQEAWVSQKAGSSNNVLAYVLRMREKMEEVTKMVRKRMERVQRGQQTWYDKGARERSFEPGQQVLLLLPTVENKLLAKWQGPYSIIRKLSSTTYEIEMPERRNPRQAFHINLLKEWKTREPPPSQQLFVRAVKEEEDAEGEFTPTIHSTASLDLSHLSLTQQQELEAIIPPDLFQEKPGTTDLVKHDIHLKDSTPIRQRMYRIPERMVPVLMEEIEVMLELGVIEPSTSEWSNPVVLVIKKDGSIRFCIDFRKVNAQSDFDAYPLPRLDDLIEQVGQARFISTLDLCKGYWQVPLTEAAKPLTAFRTPQGLWQFTKMPFGLQGAPATFQRLMNRVLSGMGTFCAAYLDDIVIYSNSWQEHLTHLKEVLQRIKQAGLTINPRKCALARQELQYLGHILGGGVIKPVKDKVVAVKARERPTTRKQVKSFLGLVGWYRRFIRDFSARAAPLSDLTSTAKTKIVWGEEQERAFQDLKEALCQEPVLQSPNFSLPFTVQTDASHRGIGGVLLQGEGEDKKPVAYISRKLFPRETRYSAVELECLAVKWAIDSFRYYLLGREFTLETDHRALQWLESMKDTNSRITRWFLSLQPYRFCIRHVPGKQNTVADFLSRSEHREPSEGEGNVRELQASPH
ncbi:uncharacterized protein LOC115368085 [Myripristis murdjan]|uniref:uncharacterized protein LOC115368085 n=1 Tax=Myripristis murdjan TaxID=586833 RepID=UPI0011760E95|nr:uncharacterized protein LOC115368085 [Myripristis murdjan]